MGQSTLISRRNWIELIYFPEAWKPERGGARWNDEGLKAILLHRPLVSASLNGESETSPSLSELKAQFVEALSIK